MDAVSPSPGVKSVVRRCRICGHHCRYQLHGFSQYLLCTSAPLKVVWAVVICTLFLSALGHSVFLLNEYVDRRVVTRNTIHQVPRLTFPNITVCPKHVDSLNFTAIEKDIHTRLPNLTEHEANQLIIAGFQHFDSYTQLVSGEEEVHQLAALWRQWRAERTNMEFFKFLFEENGYSCEQLFQTCLYGKRRIPCCDLFKQNYVMLRGRCFKMRKLAQTAPDEAGKLTIFFNQMPSPFLEANGSQRQVVAYLSQRYEDIPTFPRFYLNENYWYRLRLKKKHVSMLSPNPHCTAERKARGNCYVESWLRERVTKPFNCTIFYLAHKNPELEVCDPEVIFLHYRSVQNVVSNRSAYQNLTKCLPACERDIIDTELYSNRFQETLSNSGGKGKEPFYHLEASYENLQIEFYEEQLTTTTPGFISQIGGQLSFFLGFSLISLLQFIIIPLGNFFHLGLSNLRARLLSM